RAAAWARPCYASICAATSPASSGASGWPRRIPMRRLVPEECAVLVVDVQERLAAAMPPAQMSELTRAATVLIDAALLLNARVLCTEQYSKGLGSTTPAVAAELARAKVTPIAKMEFSACDNAEFDRAFARAAVRTVVVVGMETHVCVFQTVREL